jgi:hypothetical protein
MDKAETNIQEFVVTVIYKAKIKLFHKKKKKL